MTAQAAIRANLASVRKELAETFPRLADEMLPWAPAEGMRTVHGQFVEILSTERTILDRLTACSREDAEQDLWDIETLEGLIEKATEIRQATLNYLDGLDEDALAAPANVSEGFAKWLELSPVPVAELLRFIARHESYHAGQLVAYLWARGDDPYAWD